METFYVDFVETGNPRKVPFALRTDDQMSMFCKSGSKSLSDRVVQRVYALLTSRKVLLIAIPCWINPQKSVLNRPLRIVGTYKRLSKKCEDTRHTHAYRGAGVAQLVNAPLLEQEVPGYLEKNRRNSACVFRYFKRTFHDILSDRETILEKYCSFLMLLDSTTLKRVRFTSKVNYRTLNCKFQ